MVQMLSMPAGPNLGCAGVSGHDLPTTAGPGAHENLRWRPPFGNGTQSPLACLLENVSHDHRQRTEGADVEVKIGITDSPRELVFSSSQTQDEVQELVDNALGKDSNVLSMSDEKGRRFLVSAAKIAYVEIGVADVRRVGFGLGSAAARNG
jgi:hypothetical protein